MKILITGACGLLGSHLAAALSDEHDVAGIDRRPWPGEVPATIHTGDLEDETFTRSVIDRERPGAVIHCAAMVDVDGCERDPVASYRVNGHVTGVLARQAGHEALFVYVTTDSLFRGDSAFATETDLPCPRTVYARSKLHGEWDTRLATDRHLIVRTNFFGWASGDRPTFGEWMYAALERGERITLFDDVYFTPLYVMDLVRGITALVAGGHTGTVNVCGGERVSKYAFGMEMARQAGFSTSAVTRGSIDRSGAVALRPKDMSLSADKFRQITGLEPPLVAEGLQQFLADRGRSLAARAARKREQ